jgi:hypothetical protein
MIINWAANHVHDGCDPSRIDYGGGSLDRPGWAQRAALRTVDS